MTRDADSSCGHSGVARCGDRADRGRDPQATSQRRDCSTIIFFKEMHSLLVSG